MIYEKRLLVFDLKEIAECIALYRCLTEGQVWLFNNILLKLRDYHLTPSESFRVIARYVKKYEGK